MTYRKKITLIFTAYSIILTLVYSILIWGALFITEDQLYKHLLEQYYTKAYEKYETENNNINFGELLISHSVYNKNAIPKHLQNLPEGVMELNQNHILVKTLKNDEVLFLTFPEVDSLTERVEPLILLLLFIFSLIIIFLGTAIALLLARQLSTPIERLVSDVKATNIDIQSPCKESDFYEINMLARSFNEAMLKIKKALEREKSFTESVSHELRTPLMVLNTNLDILKTHKDPATIIGRVTERMSRAMKDMSNLTNVFLVLARHDKFTIEKEYFDPLNTIITTINTAADSNICWNIEPQDELNIHCPADLFRIMISNIVDNANKYADNSVELIITNKHLETYNNIKKNTQHGHSSKLGINIIERICHALDWKLDYKLSDTHFRLRINFC